MGMQGGSIWEEEDPQGTKKHNSITIRTMNYSDMSQTEPRHVLMFEKMFKSFKIKIFAELAQICESLDHFPSNGDESFPRILRKWII